MTAMSGCEDRENNVFQTNEPKSKQLDTTNNYNTNLLIKLILQ